jgi:hypothetical protein
MGSDPGFFVTLAHQAPLPRQQHRAVHELKQAERRDPASARHQEQKSHEFRVPGGTDAGEGRSVDEDKDRHRRLAGCRLTSDVSQRRPRHHREDHDGGRARRESVYCRSDGSAVGPASPREATAPETSRFVPHRHVRGSASRRIKCGLRSPRIARHGLSGVACGYAGKFALEKWGRTSFFCRCGSVEERKRGLSPIVAPIVAICPLLLRRAPPPPTRYRGDDLNPSIRHATIPMNSHMTHTLR